MKWKTATWIQYYHAAYIHNEGQGKKNPSQIRRLAIDLL